MITTIVFITTAIFLVWVYFQLVNRIGIQQKIDWEDFKRENSHLFVKPIVRCQKIWDKNIIW